MFEKILICLDGSILAEQILPYTFAEAKRFNSKVTLLQVVTSEVPVAAPGDPQLVVKKLDEVAEGGKNATAYLKRIERRFQVRGIDVEYVVGNGSAGETIVAYAKNNNIDLIAMGTHGHSGMGRLIFGSVAEFVVRESGLPVLMIKPK